MNRTTIGTFSNCAHANKFSNVIKENCSDNLWHLSSVTAFVVHTQYHNSHQTRKGNEQHGTSEIYT